MKSITKQKPIEKVTQHANKLKEFTVNSIRTSLKNVTKLYKADSELNATK